MVPKLNVNAAASAYSKAFQRLRALPGFNHQEVIRAEAGVILKRWAGLTKVVTTSQIERRVRARVAYNLKMQQAGGQNPYGITINNGARGGEQGEVWFRTRAKKFQQAGVITRGDTFVASWKHFRGTDWDKILAGGKEYSWKLTARRNAAKRSANLSRQSVVQIADQLGIDLNQIKGQGISASGIAKARAAIASSGRVYENGMGFQGGDPVRYYVDLINRLPYNTKIGMDRTLRSILAGRAKYIETSYEKGAFDSMKSVAAAFPNITVRPTLVAAA